MNLNLPHSKAVRETEEGVEYIYIFLSDIDVCVCTHMRMCVTVCVFSLQEGKTCL